jgi:CDP-paratose 2-epimerase
MSERYVITGGAGFIGTNVADHHLQAGAHVTLIDNLSRPGSESNVEWLTSRHPRVSFVRGDVRRLDAAARAAIDAADVVYHFAAQVAVTTSVTDPVTDFEINACGTFNVLEAVRQSPSRPALVYSSTNKVYGKLDDLDVTERSLRCELVDLPCGVPETRPLDFYSPYGCSKGAGDQYVRDYARMYGLDTIVFRQSCIYGPHQFGIEDQGWVAWFAIRAAQQRPVTIFGSGRQVRDVLYVGDLIAAYDAALANIETTRGQVYNIGGGPANTLSLLELVDMLEATHAAPMDVRFDDWRPGDQAVYISDIRKAAADFGWTPQVQPRDGVRHLVAWLESETRAAAPA